MKRKNLIIIFITTIIVAFTLAIIQYTQSYKNSYVKLHKKVLFNEAKSLYSNMINVRTWSSSHGGVYVKANGKLKPNPYLEDNVEYTKNNEQLIRVNPAWMTRQISEISNKKQDYYFKITSLNPLNPHNLPDTFERKALIKLKTHPEKKFFTEFEDNKYNFLGELRVEKTCLQCHSYQNLKVGDIIGGLRVSLPINSYKKSVDLINTNTFHITLIVIFTSLCFIGLIIFTINSIFKKNKDIKILNRTLEKKVEKRTKELQVLNNQLKTTAITDYLTNIPNRRFFFEMGNKSFSLAKRENKSISIICLDIDYFKRINDNYGHHAGDKILIQIANTLKTHTRDSDIVARTGGEEFSIIVNNTDIDGALKLAEKIRVEIQDLSTLYKQVVIKVTVSIGVTQIKQDDTFQKILNRADSLLYKAKDKGRNTIVKA
ncbi:diguanylate cyclase [Arcobacter sp. CECT 8985]|uniref:diguanylate cyclase n=1 Tax=Arcobacter sp. CECT 8985 TaxID=1935424 RepID=UPI00100C32F5|nr:diguanylate cyclase [Arcobacter sp. CECT 8985]RXJ87018.1 hypothetical protein CRU93_06435 [Arcobacter sp. CECT 8985]